MFLKKIFRKRDLKIKTTLDYVIEGLVIISILFLCYTVNRTQKLPYSTFARYDVFYEYSAAVDISNGVNPYEKIIGDSLLINNKYATLFPLYYYFLLGLAYLANFSFFKFIDIYSVVLFVAECSAFIFTYLTFRKHNKLLGFAAAGYLILNRWAIHNVADLKQDMIAIAILMASSYFFNTKKRLSYLLYGFSLGIKHLGIFFLPIYFMPLILGERKLKDFIYDLLVMLSPLLIPAIPFIFSNLKAFVLSLLFSFTRIPASSQENTLYGYEKLLVLYGDDNNVPIYLAMLPRLPLVGFSLVNAILLFTKKIPLYAYALIAIVTFITFNPVYFEQYSLWFTPFVYSVAILNQRNIIVGKEKEKKD